MNIKQIFTLAAAISALNLTVFTDVSASSIKVKCEVRASPLRSKISVDGSDLTGNYFAQVKSGGVLKTSGVKTADSAKEVQVDFDSNPLDIKAGATAIPAGFIKNKSVIGYIRKSGTNAIVGATIATCSAK